MDAHAEAPVKLAETRTTWCSELRLAALGDGFPWAEGQGVRNWAGRGEVQTVQTALGTAVVRHYRRGGLLGRVLRDLYLYTGRTSTRPMREFRLLLQLQQWRLPAPRPLAARFRRWMGIGYTADLATALIADTHSLDVELRLRGLQPGIARAVGELIAEFHALGVWHADLNAHNILVAGSGDYSLIDFDRCELRAPHPRWQQSNLERLQRSLIKLGHLRLQDAASEDFMRELRAAHRAGLLSHLDQGDN